MISLTKSGYQKFIQGTQNIFSADIKVAPLYSGITNNTFDLAGVNAKRTAANINMNEFAITDFQATYSGDPTLATDTNNFITMTGLVNINSTNFVSEGDTAIGQEAAVIDTADSDEPLGMIKIYPTGSEITYSALNSAPVNIDYRTSGMAKIEFKSSSSAHEDIASSRGIYTDIFPKSILKLPFFDNTVTCNLLTDLRIALLSSNDSVSETTFQQNMYLDSKSLSTIESMDNSTKYHYISGGLKFENLGYHATLPALSASDTTFYIPDLTINDAKVFAVVYFEDTSAAGSNVMSDTYKQNSYILTTVHNKASSTNTPNTRFSFKQSVIIDALTPTEYGDNVFGIMPVTNTVGPGFTSSNLD